MDNINDARRKDFIDKLIETAKALNFTTKWDRLLKRVNHYKKQAAKDVYRKMRNLGLPMKFQL